MISDSLDQTPSPAATPGSNMPVYTVGELSGALKRTIESAYGAVRVRGELSGVKRHGSGHIYLALKDADAVIDGVCWRGTVSRLALQPEDGMEVICTGRLTTFPGRSKYQLVIERMELAGEGALLKLLEDRKRRLAAEGLFAEERKRPLPYLPEVIGVVTSPTGAVIRDILHRLRDRFPRHVLLWPVAVQGEGAAAQIAAAIAGFNALPASAGGVPRPDLLIVARGGGSLEDLMAFNEEIVVRAAAASGIPLISAVGHETDTTLIDYASDRRAPTPTAAAEMAVPVRLDLLADLLQLGGRLGGATARLVGERGLRVEGLARGLPNPIGVIEVAAQRLDDRAERLDNAWAGVLRERMGRIAAAAALLKHPRIQLADHARQLDQAACRLAPAVARGVDLAADRLGSLADRLASVPIADTIELRRAALADLGFRLGAASTRRVADLGERTLRLGQMLDSLSPTKVLERGYAVVMDRAGHALTSAGQVAPGDALSLRFHDGAIAARAEAGGTSDPAPPRKRSAPASADAPKQGSLL
ncbi:MAG TPA: exodeoxyribonuclease VII large subunit [Stellaceae bacterium]|nr:exodeoxyribonuclease VII large subunit [Stellaceae bacterium]